MASRQDIEQAIAVLETHRDILEKDVVDTATAVLREKLLVLQTSPSPGFQQNMAVLVADMSGFTAMSEMMDAEEVRDTINAIWQQLDGVIAAWGGQIDQHVGDGVVALFSVVTNLADCAERAILAALDMQLELALFNHNRAQEGGTEISANSRSDFNLQMRIGVHTGPVVFGKVGSSIQFTAVGDTMAIANQLEHAAPIGKILASDNVFDQIQHIFETEILPPLQLAETNRQMPIHIVQREKYHALQDADREVLPNEPRFVGRNDELIRLQAALETVVDRSKVQVITILGEAGMGKSRLRIEFEKLLALQPIPVHLFKGSAEDGITSTPYAAMHRMLANYFDIHQRSSRNVARSKLVEGITSVLSPAAEDAAHARERAHFIGHLLGFDFADSPYLEKFQHDPRRIREYAFQDLAKFFTAVTSDRPAVLLLENMELADGGLLDLVDYLVQICAEQPLLIICLARPTLLTRWSSCQLNLSVNPHTFSRLNLAPLSPINSRHLISDRLQNIPRLPLRLADLLATSANGNPFLIIELIELLGEIGVIIKGSKQWRVQLAQLNDLHGELTLDWLLEKQLERLSPVEQTILQKAAIIGNTFWKTAVIELIHADNTTITAQQVQAALRTLEQQELIYRRTTSIFPDTFEYTFRHAPLHRVAYDTQSLPQRQASHAKCALWFRSHDKAHLPNFSATVAFHLEQAGKTTDAADWYRRAADNAREHYTPDTTIQYYQQALNLLPDTDYTQRILLSERLGQILREQARFDEAITLFTEMRAIALSIKDSDAAGRVFRHLFIIQNFQGEHHAALETAEQAEEMARTNDAPEDLSAALTAKGWAYAYLGNLRLALALGKQALAISSEANAKREKAYSHALLGTIYRILREFDSSHLATETALALFREIGEWLWIVSMLHNLGRITFIQHDYTKATAYFEESLQLARDSGDHFGAMRNLKQLSAVAQQRGLSGEAKSCLQQAVIWAEKSGNTLFRVMTAADLGRHFLNQQAANETAVTQTEHLQQARRWLERGWQLVKLNQQPLPRVTIQIEMARLLLAEQKSAQALSQMRKALTEAHDDKFMEMGVNARKTCAVAWRELGNIAIELPPEDIPIRINTQVYDIPACFKQSIQILFDMKHGSELETARSLFAWAVYNLRWGNHQRGEILWRQAQTVFTQLGMTEEIAKMDRFAL